MAKTNQDPPEPEEPADPAEAFKDTRVALIERSTKLGEMLAVPEGDRRETWNAEIRSLSREVEGFDARLTALHALAVAEAPPFPQGQGPQAATRHIGTPSGETRSIGQQVVESREYKEWIGDYRGDGKSRAPNGSTDVRTLITGVQTDTGNVLAGAFAPIMPYAIFPQAVRRDRLVVRDLLPTTTTTYEVIHGVGETYVSGSDATMVAEAALKPEVAMNWYQFTQLVQKIAAWVPATTEALADVGGLRSAIDNRLQYKLARAEETELLSGSGTAPHLLGLLNGANIQTQSFVTNAFTSIADGRALIEGHDGDATGMVMNPVDYWTAMATSSSTLLGASPFQGPPDTLWGLPVVRTPRMTQGHALLGDFKQGAEIFDREDMNIRVGDQHSDFFIRNQVAILIEKREALVIYRSDLFVNVAVA